MARNDGRDESGRFVKGNTIGQATQWTEEDLTKYKEEYCEGIVKWFEETAESGRLPTLPGYATHLDVTQATIQNWAEKHPPFRVAKEKALQIQQEYLMVNGVANVTNPTMTIFLLKNCHGFSDKVEQEIKTDNDININIKVLDDGH